MTATEIGRLLLDARGRINRKGLLAVAVPLVCVQLSLYAVFGMFGWTAHNNWFAFVAEFTFVIMALVLAAKRLHDCNLSGWWIVWSLLAVIVLISACTFGFLFLLGLESLRVGHIGYVSTVGVNVMLMMAALLWLHCKKGTEGTNRFGPEPNGFGISYPEQDAQVADRSTRVDVAGQMAVAAAD